MYLNVLIVLLNSFLTIYYISCREYSRLTFHVQNIPSNATSGILYIFQYSYHHIILYSMYYKSMSMFPLKFRLFTSFLSPIHRIQLQSLHSHVVLINFEYYIYLYNCMYLLYILSTYNYFILLIIYNKKNQWICNEDYDFCKQLIQRFVYLWKKRISVVSKTDVLKWMRHIACCECDQSRSSVACLMMPHEMTGREVRYLLRQRYSSTWRHKDITCSRGAGWGLGVGSAGDEDLCILGSAIVHEQMFTRE